MKESTTYQAILEEGRIEGLNQGLNQGLYQGRNEGRTEEARNILLRLGTKRFGPLPPHIQAEIAGIASVERLERLTDRVLDVESWEELLAGA
jgi:predicted transposase YdaD